MRLMRSISFWSRIERSNSRYCSICLSISTHDWHMQSVRRLSYIRPMIGLWFPAKQVPPKRTTSKYKRGQSGWKGEFLGALKAPGRTEGVRKIAAVWSRSEHSAGGFFVSANGPGISGARKAPDRTRWVLGHDPGPGGLLVGANYQPAVNQAATASQRST
jgi:hypothetical protein